MSPNFLIFYVTSPAESTAFYADLLGCQPVEASATFAMFALENAMMLGLWARETVEPAAPAAVGGSELAFVMGDDTEIEACHVDWKAKGIVIAQVPTRMDFGYTFVGLDPDGHRLRVFAPNPR